MEIPSRRNVLRAGGALGAVGAISASTPAWSWSAAGSVVGSGAGLDPKWVWDPEADALVASLIDRGDVPRVNELLRTWTKNGQALPAGLPADLKAFMESARALPAWADQAKLKTVVKFNEKRGLYLGLLYGLASGMVSTVIPKEARAVYHSQGGADMKDRISKTAKLGYDIMTAKSFEADGTMIVTCVKTRLVHAAVRHLLPQSPYWTASADEDIPISQADLMVTWHSLPTTVMKNLVAWKVPIPAAESEAFLHSWQLVGHLLGIKDEYIPASWDQANLQAKQVLDPILAPTTEGIALADILVNLGKEIDGSVLSEPVLCSMTRFMLGEQIADWLKLQKTPVFDALLKSSWKPFIAVREGLLPFPLAPAAYWTFDEILRKFTLLFLSEGAPISIEIPVTNRPA
ncbi:oxygenase MpaB family protein [Actinocorallia aurea]